MSFDVTSDHADQVSQLGFPSVTLTNVAGDTLYYGDPNVSSTHNLGSLTAGNFATFTQTTWMISASRTTVALTYPTGSTPSLSPTSTPTLASWYPYKSNPVTTKAMFSGSSALGGTFSDVWWDGTSFHMFTMVDGTSAGIYHGVSTDGLTFTFDASPCLTVGAGGAWDQTTVGVPTVFNVGTTLHMYYRGSSGGTNKIGHATTSTSTPGSGWSKDAGNPVITSPTVLPGTAIDPGPGRIILVGSTYYFWVSNVSANNRCATVFTATDPGGPWTLLTGTWGTTYPIFAGGRFCNSIWTDGGFFYSLVPHYRAAGQNSLGAQAEIELWRSTVPTFLPSEREFLGVVRSPSLQNTWENTQFDCPVVVCDDITRSSFNCTGGRPQIYYSGQDNSSNWLTGVLLPDATIYHPIAAPAPRQMVGPWNTSTMDASQSNVQMALLGGGLSYIAVPYTCSVVSVGVNLGATGHLTGGSVTATVTKATNASPFHRQLTTTLSAASSAYISTSIEEGEWVFFPGDLIGVQLTTSSGFTATASQIDVSVGIIPR